MADPRGWLHKVEKLATDSQPPWLTVEKKQYKLQCENYFFFVEETVETRQNFDQGEQLRARTLGSNRKTTETLLNSVVYKGLITSTELRGLKSVKSWHEVPNHAQSLPQRLSASNWLCTHKPEPDLSLSARVVIRKSILTYVSICHEKISHDLFVLGLFWN